MEENVSPTSPASEIFLKQANLPGLGHWTGRGGGCLGGFLSATSELTGLASVVPFSLHAPLQATFPCSTDATKMTSLWEPYHRHVVGQPGTHTVTFLFFPPMPDFRVGPEGRKKGKNGSAEGLLDWTALGYVLSRKQQPRPLCIAYRSVSHPERPYRVACPTPGNLQMQTEVERSCFSKCVVTRVSRACQRILVCWCDAGIEGKDIPLQWRIEDAK